MNKFTLILLMLYCYCVQAQVTVQNTLTPAQLTETVLVGEGVVPFNITFNGSAGNANVLRDQAGKFVTNFNGSNLGVDQGIVLTTGKCKFVESPPIPASSGGPGTANQWPSTMANGPDPDLAALSSQTIFNSVILEFDFVATGLELNFDFVFASKEYPEFVSNGGPGGVNDAFGFFLSGPGISGPFSNSATNIALIPNTTIPVSINSVNNGYLNNGNPPGVDNSQYYFNNLGTTGYTVNYDGFTIGLVAKATLECGATYHIKLALGNAQDPLYDSAVFLRNFRIKPLELLANGFTYNICPGTEVEISSGIVDQGFNYVWTKDGQTPPIQQGPNLPNLIIPAGSNPAQMPATSCVAGKRYQITSLGTAANPTDFTTIGAPDNLLGTIFTATAAAAGTGTVVPVHSYELKYYTAGGCLLGQDSFELVYFVDPLADPVAINLCSNNPPPYSLGNIDQTSVMLNGQNPVYYDIRYFRTLAEAQMPTPPAGIPATELADYDMSVASETIYVRFEDLIGSGCVFIKSFALTAGLNPSGTFSYPGSPYCATLTTQPITSSVTPGGTYTASPTPGLSINSLTGEVDPSSSTPGNYTVQYSLAASATCPPFAPPGVPVSIVAVPLAPSVTSPVTYCQFETAAPLTPAGSNFLWYDVASGGVGSTTPPTPDTSLVGNKTYYVSEVNGCEGPRSPIDIHVNAAPAPPTFNPVAPYCQNATASVLMPNETSNLLWYTSLTGGVGSPTAPIPSTANPGVINYYVTQTINNCESQRGFIAIQTLPTPLLPVPNINPVVYCQDEVPSPILVGGVNLQWYTVPNGGVGSAATPVVDTSIPGSLTYYITQTVDGCEGPRKPLVINIMPAPAAPAVSPVLTYCQYETAPPLTATGSNLLWYTDPTNGTGDPNPPTPSTLNAGSTTYYVSQSSAAGCESTRSAITVNVTPAPPAPMTTPVTYCQNQPAVALNLNATGSNLLWYNSPTGGTGSTIAPTPSTLVPGLANYYVTQTAGGCESARAAVAVTTTALPLAPTVSAVVNYCQGSTPVALTASGSNLLWYTAASGGSGDPAAQFPSTLATGNTNYYVSQTVNGCEGPRAMITVQVNPIPTAPSVTVTQQPTCAVNTGIISVSAPLGANLEYSINNGISYQSGNTFTGVPAGATYDVIVRNSVTGCTSTAVQVTVDPAKAVPAAPNASVTFQPNCIVTTGTIQITAPTGANLEYTIDGGTTYQTQTLFPNLTPNTTYNLIVRNTASGCSSTPTPVTINPIPANPPAPTGTVVHQPTCAISTGEIHISAPAGANFEYSINGGATYQSATDFPGLLPNATYNITVRNTVTGCVSAPTAFLINMAPTIPATPIASATDVCSGEPIALTTPTVAGATYSWTGPNGFTSSDQNPVISNADIYMSGSYSVVISTTADCPSAPGSVSVNVNPLPQPVLPQNGYICFNTVTNSGDSYVLNAGLDNATYDFQWFVNNTGSFAAIPLETQNTYTVTVPGTYAVQATNSLTGCVSAMVTAPVSIASPPLQLVAISSEYFADVQSITINVEPAGEYEYQLDNGAFQSSNVFNDVLPGNHDVKVRNQCGELPGIAYLLDFPKFFTPNADGYNDTWNIFALSSQANAKIYIFDRYGKLIKQISPSGKGWDGTYNNQVLPGSDYWFTVEYEENTVRKEFKSHFALKR